jgi:hypothetical protein
MFRLTPGEELTARIVADMAEHGLEPDGKERELLTLAEGLADRLAELEDVVEREGLSVTLQSGQVVMNPAVGESRMTRAALARVLAGVSMTEGRAKDPAKVRAAQARWLEHNIAKARQRG